MSNDEAKLILDDEDFPELRNEVRKLCEKYPAEYWLALEDEPPGLATQPNLSKSLPTRAI